MVSRERTQVRYRNDSKIFALVREFDERGKCATGAFGAESAQPAHFGAIPRVKRSSEITARKAGTSARTVERIRTILDHGDESLIAHVESGAISIHGAYQEVTGRGRAGDRLSILELFHQGLSMMMPEEKFSRVLNREEETVIERLAESFRDHGYLDSKEIESIKIRIHRVDTAVFGGL